MQKFKGNKPLEDIKSAVIKNGWPWDQSKYDNEGSDWLTFGFMHDNLRLTVVYNTLSGRFLVRPPGEELITEASTHMEGTGWYDALLDFVYEPAIEEAA